MNSSATALRVIVLVVSILVFLAALGAAVGMILKRKLLARLEEVKSKFKGRFIRKTSYRANFAGLKSKGPGQIRGNGVMLLFEDGIYFEMLMPERIVEIPIDKIVSISKPNSFLYKSKGVPLLQIDYINEEDTEESAAWWIDDLDGWIEIISERAPEIKT